MFHPARQRDDQDAVARLLTAVAQNTLVIVLGLFPLLFVPIAYAPFNYSKILFVLVGVAVSLIFFSLAVLRNGSLSLRVPLALLALWGVVGAYVLATIFSGDMKDALIGNAFEVHTTAFILLIAAIVSALTMLRSSKIAIVRLYGLLVGSGILLALYHITRIIAGPDSLTLGTFTNLISSPFGAWNGLAIFFGLIILIALVAIEQLPLTRIGKILLILSSVLALFMLMVVNYFAVWVVLAVVSFILLIYSLASKHYQKTDAMLQDGTDSSFIATIFTTIVLAISLLFILGGSMLGSMVSERTGISYVEVRPSFSATFDIARNVYADSPIFGVGPNKFIDAWRMYKDPSLNQTIFWDTSFDSGSGFIPTSFITTGLLGVVAWTAFLLLLLWHGFQLLSRISQTDRFWRFIGTSSFVAAVYLWGMTLVYTPSSGVLILAAAATGIFFAAYQVLVPQREMTFSVLANRAFGIVLVGVVVLVILGAVGSLYATGKHYSALYAFNKTFATLTEEDTLETVQERIAAAYDRSSNDIFARQIAQYRLAQINTLLGLENPTVEQQEGFQAAVADGVSAAQVAVEIDPTEPLNWQVLGQLYSALTFAGVEGSADRARDAYERARTYAPQNPTLLLLQAQLASRTDNLDRARELAEQSVAMKRDYTEALLFLSQIDILNNDVVAAIGRTESIISIEPNNPARYYQLGILEIANGNQPRATAAFERAVSLDGQYANARYYLALLYAEADQTDAAIDQLRVVAELNPDNADIRTMITRLENGEPIVDPSATASLETEGSLLEDGEVVTSSTVSGTSLVSPVNVVPDENATTTNQTTTSGE